MPVRGVVTFRGAPVEQALVVFSSRGEAGRSASDYTDAEGRFELTTYISPSLTENGALPTDYDVNIFKNEPMQRVELQPGARKARDLQQDPSVDPQEVLRLMRQGLVDPGDGMPIMVTGKSLIPERYCDTVHPALTASVERDQPNEFNFNLED